jgi:serine/threonine protein kinase/nitrous oxidase accessory protein NosD
MPTDLVQFLEQGQRSGLFSPAVAQDVIGQMTADQNPSTDAVAAQMIERKVLTAFQAEQLLAGRGDECLLAGRYRLLENLGEGGMGAVYKAHDIQLDRDVAVKVLPAQSVNDADAIARFRREARALAKLSHPNIIQAYDSGEDKERHFLVMEFVAGVSLAAILREQGALAPTQAADLIYQAALGLQHAHEKGLVHRDLKPANLFLSTARAAATRGEPAAKPQVPAAGEATTDGIAPAVRVNGIVKILDLGLARFLQDQLGDAQVTREGSGLGTPDYMAPEQFRDALHADARTDIYGLGCTLYHLISGSVPFPGSSFSEKAQAHAKKEPIPLEERCPEVPAGLAFVAAKMLAKHPADRYQTAAQVAEALTPYLAGGSQSMILLRQTGRFPNPQLTMQAPKRSKRLLAWAGRILAAACFIGLFILAWPSIFPGSSQESQNNAQDKGPFKPEPKGTRVVTITNGLTVAQDGSGQFTTISAALEKVQPGQTIRVLDGERYEEILSLTNARLQAGITIEAAPGGQPTIIGLRIQDVPRVVIRGFRLAYVELSGRSPGVILERLEIAGSPSRTACVRIQDLASEMDDPPVVISNCQLKGGQAGVELWGVHRGNLEAAPSRRIILQNNLINGCRWGVYAEGLLQNVHIVGNRLTNASTCGILLQYLMPGTEQLLMANNTFADCDHGVIFQAEETDPFRGKQVQFSNNLFLNCTSDVDFWVSKSKRYFYDGPGDAQSLMNSWQVSFNGRETTKEALGHKGRLPLCRGDFVQEQIPVLSRNPTDANFLQPAKDSPLATGGAGGDLPKYVGAVPAEGVASWDWQKTWNSRHPKMLLTVSQDQKDGGEFRTIAEALAKVKPKQTIRVLDAGIYREGIRLGQASRFADITIEAPRAATLSAMEDNNIVVVIDVPGVTIRGFRIRGPGMRNASVAVAGRCPGTTLQKLHIDSGFGVVLWGITGGDDEPPVLVENCTLQLRGGAAGLRISGIQNDFKSPRLCRRIVLRGNRIQGASFGAIIHGQAQQVQIVGNRISGAESSAVALVNLLPGTRHLLIANNTLWDNQRGFTLLHDTKKNLPREDIQVKNNLVVKTQNRDFAFVDGIDLDDLSGEGDGASLPAIWQFAHNWREGKMPGPKDEQRRAWIPPTSTDVLRERIALLSTDPLDPDFLRPAKDSPLATAGVGGGLPKYVGAIPPEGVEPWDWNQTWKAQTRALEQKKRKTGKD